MNCRAVLSVARIDLLDLGRVRSTWLALLLFPLINVTLIVVLPGLLTEREQSRQQTAVFEIAVEGAAVDVRAVTDALRDRNLRVRRDDDAKRAVLERRADAGVLVPTGAAAALGGDATVELRAVVIGTRDESRQAFGRLVSALEQARTRIALERIEAHGLAAAVVAPIEPRSIDLADTARGGRLDLATVLPLILLLPLSGAIGMSGQRISGSKDARVLEPLLLLPVRRATLLAGKAVAGFVLSSVTVPAVAIPLVLGRLVPIGGTGQRVAVPLGTTLGVVGIAFLLVALLVSVGVCAGAASRTSAELGSILPFVSFPVILLALAMQIFGDLQSAPALLALPLLGPVLVARDLVAGATSLGDASLAIAATVAWALALLSLASRLLDRDSNVVRQTAA